jgi:hypothetical protein
MLQGINKAVVARRFIDGVDGRSAILEAYRGWADNFGVASPSPALKERVLARVADETERESLMFRLENYFKWMVAAESLGASGLRRDTSDGFEFEAPNLLHFEELLRVAFHPHRCNEADLYSPANRSLCDISDSALAMGDARWREIAGQVFTGTSD